MKSLLHAGYHHPTTRKWQSQHQLTADNLVYPIFVTGDNPDAKEEIPSMPGQFRYGLNTLKSALDEWTQLGLKTVLIFGVISQGKDATGKLADDPNGPTIQAIKLIRQNFPNLVVACDVCMCPFTDHGHCGILNGDGTIHNTQSTSRLAQIALAYAKAGAHIVAPSDMMDGRIKSIKQELVKAELSHRVAVMSYSAKFASAFYGPFRDAAKSSPSFGDRKCYQLPPGSRGLARRAILRDVEEGADMLMVKPGYPYLDIVRDAAELAPDYPIAIYQVSGEYSMLYHAAVTHGLIDLKQGVMESLDSCMRAGASILITYWTPEILKWLSADKQ